MSEPTPAPAPVAGPPVLVGHHLRVEVVCEPPAGSPFGPITLRVCPFTRAEGREYLAALDGKRDAEYEREQCKRLAARIHGWDVEVTPGVPAEVNPGTVERLPAWAFARIEAALFGEAGKLLGN
jgi:hypothetical protein